MINPLHQMEEALSASNEENKRSHTPNCSEDMKRKGNQTTLPALQAEAERIIDLPGYPLYPANEDIFSKYTEAKDINPEDTSQTKESDEHYEAGGNNEKDFSDDVSGSDLDVPGSELDDEQERVGNEDEENNLYSLGGDSHND
jgi:hypothetical protein